MNKDTLTLADGTTLNIESGSSLSAIKVSFATKDEMLKTWDIMTKDNLAKVVIKNSDGLTVATYDNLMLVSETSTVNTDGTISTNFNIRQLSDIELRMDALEESQADQDAAISDLGALTSELAAGEV